MALGIENLKNKTIVQIAMEKINCNANYVNIEKLDWIKYKYENEEYYLKSAIITKKNTFNFSLSEEFSETYYCLCLDNNELDVIKVTDNNEKKSKITFDIDKTISKTISKIKFEKIYTIIIDNLDYWESQQENCFRIESLATKDRIKGSSGQDEEQKKSAQFESKKEFEDWYNNKTKKCCYCGVEQEDLTTYFNKNNEQYKNARQRGVFLEIERIVTAPKDKNVYSIENCALVCYICNNAKSDFLSAKSFKPIAKGINIFWNKVMNKDKDLTDEELFDLTVKFPETDIWEKE